MTGQTVIRMIKHIHEIFGQVRALLRTVNASIGIILKVDSPTGSNMDSNPNSGFGEEAKYRFREDKERIDVDDDLAVILKQLLFITDGLYEIEIHQLVYNIDLLILENYERRILDVEYTPDYHGVYSVNVSMALQKLSESHEIEAIADRYEGEPVTRYNRSKPVQIDKDLGLVIDKVLSEIDRCDMESLIKRSREQWARENTDFGESIDLTGYRKRIKSNEAEPTFDSLDGELPDSIKDIDRIQNPG